MSKKALTTVSRRPKTTYSLDSPYTAANWPAVPHGEQQNLLDLLCELLGPIGQHRSKNVVPSKGKRKRKRATDRVSSDQEKDLPGKQDSKSLPPKLADLQKHLTIGFNSTTRYLEMLAQRSPLNPKAKESPSSGMIDLTPLAVVFVPRFDQPTILHSHLPLLVKATSSASPAVPVIRLVTLPKGAEERLGIALSIPRVGLIGLLDGTPEAAPIIAMVRLTVPGIEIPLPQEAMTGAYLPVNIKLIQTTAPIETKSNNKRPTTTEDEH